MTSLAGPGSHVASPRRRRALAALAIASLRLAACGGATTPPAPATTRTTRRNSPLAELLGFDASPAERAHGNSRCSSRWSRMRDEGWEYQAVDYGAQGADFSAEFEEQINDPEAYGAKYGYGVVRSYEMQDEFGSVTFDDPNQDYVEALDGDEQQA
ncbi:MAG: hypothetical protein R2713_07390 [Ilumatobacteraceae bacterium]